MRDFSVRVAPLLVLPLVHCVLVLFADPFNFFGLPVNITSETVRTKYAVPTNPAIYRFTRYRANPKPDILLGDSRMAILTPELIKEQTDLDVANLAIPGGSFETTLDAYWLASEWTKLRSVTIGVSFDMYNDFRIGSEIATVRSLNENPMLYFTNRNVIDASIEAYKSRLGFAVSDRFQLSRLNDRQIWEEGRLFYSNSLRSWRNPLRYKARLRDIAQHCRANATQLRFVILPQHDEASRLIVQNGLSAEYVAMKSDLAGIAPLVDLSAPNELTNDRKYFTDMLHFGPEKDFRVIARLWPELAKKPTAVPLP